MYARLWWKDVRQFWPIWLVIVAGAIATQWIVLYLAGISARSGALAMSALAWASLYAIAVGAAAFAGEREAGTLALLDQLAASRMRVWQGKVSFALFSTLSLALLLMIVAAASTVRFDLPPYQAACLAMIVPLALGWGLFWSSVLKTALAACVAGVCCVGLTVIAIASEFETNLRSRSSGSADWLPVAEFSMIIFMLAFSAVFFAHTDRRKRKSAPFFPRFLRGIRLQSPIKAWPAASATKSKAIAETLEPAVAANLSYKAWLVEARVLSLQTIKEAWQTWFWLALVGIGLPGIVYSIFNRYVDPFWLAILSAIGFMAAGVSVFGLETRARTYRFLNHHGARPGVVWAVKLATWLFGLAMIGLLVGPFWIWLLGVDWLVSSGHRPLELLALPIVFPVAVICGMTCRRGITAFVTSMVSSLFFMLPLLFLVSQNVIPVPGFVFIGLVLLAISWMWRNDWILERPAPGRWLRLGLWTTIGFTLLSISFIGSRSMTVADVGPIGPPAIWNEAPSILTSPDRNAARLYTQVKLPRTGQSETSQEFQDAKRAALSLIRRAAARPDCVFAPPSKQNLLDSAKIPDLAELHRLMSVEARERLERGDLAGSWDDIIVLFRMARHFVQGSGILQARMALSVVERDALFLANAWAMAAGQSPERLRSALAEYRSLPKMPPASETIRAEANIVENTLELRAETIDDWLTRLLLEGNWGEGPRRFAAFASVNVADAPWELARARRLNRLVSAELLEVAAREPGQRRAFYSELPIPREVERALESTPRVLRSLFGNAAPNIDSDDHNEVGRRALKLILALRAWQLTHSGVLPDHLEALVPAELAYLPKDPYGDGTFGYVPWNDQPVFKSSTALEERLNYRDFSEGPRVPGSWLLYSVGPDRHDDRGAALTRGNTWNGPVYSDIPFVIPAIDGARPVEKNEKSEVTSQSGK